MIVRNEENRIGDLLQSVGPYIDGAFICDTGSTDNTIKIIEEGFGKLSYSAIKQIEFHDFSQARNEALDFVKSYIRSDDYILFMSAGQIFRNPDNKPILLEAPAYSMPHKFGNLSYEKLRIVQAKHALKWHGAAHEYLECAHKSVYTQDYFIDNNPNQPLKENRVETYLNLLLTDFAKDPTNRRTVFYIANSYFDLGRYEDAINFYNRRIELEGWAEEIWYSYYRIAFCLWCINRPIKQVERAFLEAFHYRPWRAEPLAQLVRMLQINSPGEHEKIRAYKYMQAALPYPVNDRLFIEPGCYDLG